MLTTKVPSSDNREQSHRGQKYAERMAKERAPRDLDEAKNEEARALYEQLLRTRWNGNESAAGKELDVVPSTLNKFRSGAQGLSIRTAVRLYLVAGRSVGPLVGVADAAPRYRDTAELPTGLASVLDQLRERAQVYFADGVDLTEQQWAEWLRRKLDEIHRAPKAELLHVELADPTEAPKKKRIAKRG